MGGPSCELPLTNTFKKLVAVSISVRQKQEKRSVAGKNWRFVIRERFSRDGRT